MNKIIVFLVAINCLFCFSQEKYTQKISYDLNVKVSENNHINEEMVLLLNQNESVYTSQNKIKNDSVKRYYLINKDLQGFQAYILNNDKKNLINYFIWKKSNDYIYQINSGLKIVQYKSSLPQLNWQIINNSSEEILGYKVQKAETVYEGKKYYAWFSTEIPLNNGPFVFNGLPGLILKIQNEDSSYVITVKGIKNETNLFPELEKGKKVIETKKENFYKTIEGTMKEVQTMAADEQTKKLMNKKIKQYLDAKFLFDVN